MSNRFDNKRLLYILAGLLVILALTITIKIPRERTTLKDKIVEFDSTEVFKIILHSKSAGTEPVEFSKISGKWTVSQGNIVSASRKYEVENIIMEILSIKPQNLVSKSKAKWAEFQVTDSTGTRIILKDKKGKDLADIIVGKFNYKQSQNQMNMYGRNSIQGTSYVRITGENEVYGVDGFLSLSFNRSFDDWRDNTLVTVKKDDITSIRYSYPADSSFTMSKKDTKWYVNNVQADSAKCASFLSSLSNVSGQDFNNTFRADVNPDYQLDIEGNNLLNITVKCYRQPDGSFVINSTLNPEIYFNSKPDGVFGRLFKSRKDLI